MQERTRVLLVEMPKLTRQIIKDVVGADPELEIVGEVETLERLFGAAVASKTDVVVLGVEEPRLPIVGERLLALNPRLRIVAVRGEGDAAFLWQLEPRSRELGELSPEVLLAAVRPRRRARPSAAETSTATAREVGERT